MAAIGAGVLLLCLSSSAGAYFFSQNADDKDLNTDSEAEAAAADAEAAAAAAAAASAAAAADPTDTTGSTTPTGSTVSGVQMGDVNGYQKFSDIIFTDTKIADCTENSTTNSCSINCKYNNNCIGFTFNKNDGTCCLHSELKGLNVDTNGATYVKSVDGYITKELGDVSSTRDPIQTVETGINDCSSACTGNKTCLGFSYIDGKCDLKRASISGTHQITGGQFYTRDNYPENLPKARYVHLKMTDTPSKYVIVTGGVKVIGLDGTDIAANQPVTTTASHGNSNPRGVTGEGSWHSKHMGGERSAKIDLGTEQTIKYITVNNGSMSTKVYNGVQARARFSGGGPGSNDKGAYIELLNSSGSVVLKSKDIKHIAQNYILDFTKTQDTWE